ncbi:unnamed protein product [Cunninghamella echinulata]
MNTTLIGPSPYFLGYYNHRPYDFLELLNEIKESLIHHQPITTTATIIKNALIKSTLPSITYDHYNQDSTNIIIIIDLKKEQKRNIICVQWCFNQGFHLKFQTISSSQLYHLFNYSTILLPTNNNNNNNNNNKNNSNIESSIYLVIPIYPSKTITTTSLFITESSSLPTSPLLLSSSLSTSSFSTSSFSTSSFSTSSFSTSSLSISLDGDDYYFYDNDFEKEEEEDSHPDEALFHLIKDTLQYIHSSTIYSNELKSLGSKLDTCFGNHYMLENQ